MKTALRFVFCLFIIACLVSFVGCAKKTAPPQPSAPAAPNTPAKVPAAAPAAPAQPAEAKPSAEALAAVPLDQIKADVAKMNVDQLKTKATDYKNAIVAKKAELAAESPKLKDQLVGANAQAFQTKLATIAKTVSDLTERFKLYNGKLQELGGTPVDLTN